MAKRHLELYDSEGHLLEIYLNDDEVMVGDKTLEEKLGEMDEEIRNAGDGTVKSVTLNGTKAEPDENGDVELELEVPEQVQADWEEDDPSDPAYIQHKPTVDFVLDEDSENAIANKIVTAAIAQLRTAIESVIGEGSTEAIENFQEVLDFLENVTDEETLIGLLTTLQTAINGKLDKTDVYNGLDRTTEGKALDARQGKALNDLITALQSGKSDKNATVSGVTYDTTSHKLKQTINGTTSDVANVDTAPTANSDNFVTSGGVSTALATLLSNIHIGTNGNWWVGPETDPNNDTGIKAQGPKGNSVVDGDTFDIVNNLTEGGEEDALSAEMGKVLRINLMKIYNALGVYAFPDGKPALDWGSTVINHLINVNGVTGGLTISDVEIDGTSESSLPSQIADSKSLSLKLNLPDGMHVFDGVTITMGGENITNDTGVWDESTGEIYIASVMGNIVIIATALTYVNVNNNLVFHLDCKNRGGTSGHWIDIIGNIDFTLGSAVTAADSGVVFDGTLNSYGETDSLLSVASATATVEAVVEGASGQYNPILVNPTGTASSSVGLVISTPANQPKMATMYLGYTGLPDPTVNCAVPTGNVNNFALSMNAQRYINKGVSIATSLKFSFLMNAAHTKLTIGRARRPDHSNDLAFVGTIKAIRVYNAVLTEKQQMQNWEVDKKRFNIS